MQAVKDYLRNNIKLFSSCVRWSGYKIQAILMSDEFYIKCKYKKKVKKLPDISNPQTFTEKLQWLKLYWRKDILTQCADKYEVRKFVEDRGAKEILKELYGVYSSVEEINLKGLPNAFVLKITHGCKQMIICENKADIDWRFSARLLKHYLNNNNYYFAREWAYKNIVPRIICEEHLTKDGNKLVEYNFYCYDGVPRLVEVVHRDKPDECCVNMFDIELNLLERKYESRPLNIVIERTEYYEKMLEYARKLSQGFPFVRVDLFFTNDRIYFGEMTFYPLSGIFRFNPQSFDSFLGSFLQLPPQYG